MSRYNVHEQLVNVVKQGMAQQGLNQTQLAGRAGVGQGNLSAILEAGKAASEATWQKLFDAAWP